MQTKFKKHQEVILLIEPDKEYIEYEMDYDESTPILKGMKGKINLILPNGKYHVAVLDKKGKTIAYIQMDEDGLGEAK